MARKRNPRDQIANRLDELTEMNKASKLASYRALRKQVEWRLKQYQRRGVLQMSDQMERLRDIHGDYKLPILSMKNSENEIEAQAELALEILYKEDTSKLQELKRRLNLAEETINQKLRERGKKQIKFSRQQLLEFLQSDAFREMSKYEDSDKIIEVFFRDILSKSKDDSIDLMAERFYVYATNEEGQFSYDDYMNRKRTGKLRPFKMEDFT